MILTGYEFKCTDVSEFIVVVLTYPNNHRENMSAKYLKEIEAQKKRADALKHLQQQGQSISSLNSVHKSSKSNVNMVGTDNTLDLLFKQSLKSKSTTSELEKNAKAALIFQQQLLKPTVTAVQGTLKLQDGWKEAIDNATGKSYYWNIQSNETRWEPPLASTICSSNLLSDEVLPENWVKKLHPATQQAYYYNTLTKQSSSENPLKVKASISDSTDKKRSVVEGSAAEDSNTAKKRKAALSRDIDPLDPTGGEVCVHGLLFHLSRLIRVFRSYFKGQARRRTRAC